MPIITDPILQQQLKAFVEKEFPVTLHRDKEACKIAKEKSDAFLEKDKIAKEKSNVFLEKENTDIKELDYLTIYYIIKKLDEEAQYKFICDNYDEIMKDDKRIFIYNSLQPKSLTYFIHPSVKMKLAESHPDLLKKMIKGNRSAFLDNFNFEDIKRLFEEKKELMSNIDNITFLRMATEFRVYVSHSTYEEISNSLTTASKNNETIINLVIEKYKDKINNFSDEELFLFSCAIKCKKALDKYLRDNENKERFKKVIKSLGQDKIIGIIEAEENNNLDVIFKYFPDEISDNGKNIKLMKKLNPEELFNLYAMRKDLFKYFNINDWLSYFNDNSYNLSLINNHYDTVFDIINDFEMENIEFINLHKKATTKDDIKINKYFFLEPYVYIERKYRDKIKATGKIEDIKNVDEFSYNYLKNLKEIKNMINNNTLNKEVYNSHLNKFINYIKRWISIPDDGYFLEEIQKMFIKIIKGKEISFLSKLNNEKELILLIRGINNLFDTDDFSEDQIRKFNIKQFRVLCKMVDNKDLTFHNKPLILKMLFIFGYDNAKEILKIDNSIGTIEHLVGHVSINNIIINNNGDPVLNKKLFKLLFNGENVLLNAIKNKDSDVYQYFPRIYNEWEAIVYERKNKDVGTIIDYLKSYEIILPPKYYRLQSELEYIGKSAVKIQKAMMFYDQLSKRCYSTIPKVKGSVDGFDYEILDLNDVSSLSIGNKTNCCFSIENVAHFCLLQAISSKNGRILKISKDGNLVAHSWLWRNGNLLCLDNVEVASGITKIDFLNVYLKLADEIMKISNEHEDKNRIKNVTIGYNSRDVKIEGIDAYPYFISQGCNNLLLYGSSPYEGKLSDNKKVLPELPQCLEKYKKNYSDSNKVQYLIKGDGDIKLGEPNYLYQDPRKNVLTYETYNIYDEEYKTNIKNIINAIAKKEHAILPDEYKKIYCNIDWVILVNEDGSYESYIDSNDKRAYLELREYEKKLNRKYVDEEMNIKHDIIKTLVS